MSQLPWFRAYTEMVDDEKLRLLAFEDRWHFVALLCLKGQGVLDEGGALLFRKVAVKLGLDVRSVEEVARRLAEVGLIDEKTLQPLAWSSRQRSSDADSTAAERQRRFRESQKRNALRNGEVTRLDTDTDTDTDEEANASPPVASRPAIPNCPHEQVLALFAERLPELPQPRKSLWAGSAAAKALQARWKWLLTAKQDSGKPYATNTDEGLAWMAQFFGYVSTSDFLTGRSGRWSADLGWLLKAENFAKVISGNYDNKDTP